MGDLEGRSRREAEGFEVSFDEFFWINYKLKN